MSDYNTLPSNGCIPVPPCQICGLDACDHEREHPGDPDGPPRVAIEATPDGRGGYVGVLG